MRIVRYADRPDLRERRSAELNTFPAFMNHNAMGDRYWARLYDEFPAFQLALEDGGELVAEVHSLPVRVDGDLPAGWDEAFERAETPRPRRRRSPAAFAILGRRNRRGGGLAGLLIDAARAAAREAGLTAMIAPVRQCWSRLCSFRSRKCIEWRRGDGSHFDPGSRLWCRRARRSAWAAPKSMLIEKRLFQLGGVDGDALPGRRLPTSCRDARSARGTCKGGASSGRSGCARRVRSRAGAPRASCAASEPPAASARAFHIKPLAGQVCCAVVAQHDEAVALERQQRIAVGRLLSCSDRAQRVRASLPERACERRLASRSGSYRDRVTGRADSRANTATRDPCQADGRAEIEERLRARAVERLAGALLHPGDVRVDRQHVASEREVADSGAVWGQAAGCSPSGQRAPVERTPCGAIQRASCRRVPAGDDHLCGVKRPAAACTVGRRSSQAPAIITPR